ncbi:MAG: hypothetical protein S4CHLAM6_15760 [Chlamydiae bacterium]|nr:hypothetical protein [Chlamydiota bacterium]
MSNEQAFKPYISADNAPAEFTVRAIILGIILSIFFGVGNAFIGLKVGLTVSASIPASVISMGILRMLYKDVSILENNLVQTIASAGEALAAGAIFTIPTLFFLGQEITIWRTFVLSILGGFLGIFFMLPMREHFVVKEHGVLLFPEGTACAEILKAGESGAKKALLAILGVSVGAVYRFLIGFVHLWSEVVQWTTTKFQKTMISLDTTPALLGVGFIIGPRIASTMIAGGVLGWWVIMPLIKIFGQGQAVIAPATIAIASMSNSELWANYIRYIGAGGVTLGGVFSLFRILPGIFRIFKVSKKSNSEVQIDSSPLRTQRDLPFKLVLFGSLITLVALWLMPLLNLNFAAVILIAILGFCFVAVTSMTVGIVGSSSNPASGIIIMTLLITLLIFMAFGWRDTAYMLMAATVSSVVAISICIASDTSQDLKTGFLIGATPRSQQIGMMIGTIAASAVMGVTLILLNKAYHFGSPSLSAPQATLLSLLAKGLVQGNLPFQLILVGALIGLAAELMGVHALAVAIGLYLPLETTSAIFIGGAVSYFTHLKSGESGWTEKGILFASGLVAGDALMGIVVAFFAVSGIVNIAAPPLLGPIFGLIAFLALAIFMGWIAFPEKNEPTSL